MTGWPQLLQDSLRTGVVAGATTTLVVAACGEVESGNAIAPLNAMSHIVWGKEATTQSEASWKYTATGVALTLAATTSWAGLHELFCGRAAHEGDAAGAFFVGTFVSALAYVTDYHIVPKRLTPGFEKLRSNRSILGIYTALALGLALGSLWRPDGERSQR
jgi:hypothetical protein